MGYTTQGIRNIALVGSAGAGKTLLAMEFMIRGATQFNEPGVFMCFEETADELAVVEDRQRVVAVDPPVARRVDLQPVVVAEQATRTVAVPEERVEGRQQRRPRRGPPPLIWPPGPQPVCLWSYNRRAYKCPDRKA